MAVRPTRYDLGGPIRLMAEAEGYVMLRRPGCMPFIKTIREWRELSATPIKGADSR